MNVECTRYSFPRARSVESYPFLDRTRTILEAEWDNSGQTTTTASLSCVSQKGDRRLCIPECVLEQTQSSSDDGLDVALQDLERDQ